MKERWKPENGENYWFINFSGAITKDAISLNGNHGTEFDSIMIENGNCFRTKAEAQAAAEKVKALLLSLHETVTDCNQLPKLTAEVFDRPDCPEWAKYAAVHNGNLVFTDQEPGIDEHGFIVSANDAARIRKAAIIPLKNNKHYLPQLIKRPTKDAFDKAIKKYAQQQADKILQKARERRLSEQYHNGPEEKPLLDWCKVGGWVWSPCDGGCYCRVSEIDGNRIFTKHRNENICFHIDKGDDFSSLRLCEARLRPYNADEMKALVGEVIEKGPSMHIVTGFENVFDNECMVHVNGCLYSANDLLRQFTIDNKPAGVLEHLENGEWVK